jgi:hypothetical protein
MLDVDGKDDRTVLVGSLSELSSDKPSELADSFSEPSASSEPLAISVSRLKKRVVRFSESLICNQA